jgi:hypothetical protein
MSVPRLDFVSCLGVVGVIRQMDSINIFCLVLFIRFVVIHVMTVLIVVLCRGIASDRCGSSRLLPNNSSTVIANDTITPATPTVL